MFKVYNRQQEVAPGPIEWLKLSFTSYVTRETLVGRDCDIFRLWYGVCVLNRRYGGGTPMVLPAYP